MIREELSGKRLMLTGVTGFLGTALFERLLTDVPVERLDIVIRGDAEQKLDWLLAGSAFGPARQRLGSKLDELVKQKARVISADLSNAAPPIADDIDMIIHCAAAVSFDPPIDQAFAINLLGTTRLYEAAGGRPFVHVSTAYVAGMTHGTQHEQLLEREVDWRAEAEAARRISAEAEYESRRPDLLERLSSRARAERGRAGPQSAARRTEQLRMEWLKERLVRSGTERGRSLGWPDVYTFTKALTEKALDELAGDNPLAIVRPSIIESALKRPMPGWIEGFRMADPVLLAYGRGALPDFPGIPEGVLDVIPVDLVVNCLIAVASRPLPRRSVYHVCSGDRNPLQCRELYNITREYFLENPLPERDRGTYGVPEWSFPGRPALDKKLRLARQLLDGADRVIDRIPRGPLARQTARRVDRFRRQYDFLKRYSDLYGPYIEAEVVYTDSRAKALHESLDKEDQRDFGFDPSCYTWPDYLAGLHLPMLTSPLRWVAPTRPDPAVHLANGQRSASASGPDQKKVVAAFDIEGTILASNVLESYVWLRLAEIDDSAERAAIAAGIAARVPGYLKAERRDRGYFLRMFYRQYAGVSVGAIRKLAAESLPDLLYSRLAPAAVRRIKEHRRAGHQIVFITGSLDFVVEPLQALADELVATRLREEGGVFTGDLERPPLVGESRASWLRDYADQIGADLSLSYSYADSMSDLPMLEAVGNPVAVNPDVSLARIARAGKWPVEEWAPEQGVSKISTPERSMSSI